MNRGVHWTNPQNKRFGLGETAKQIATKKGGTGEKNQKNHRVEKAVESTDRGDLAK